MRDDIKRNTIWRIVERILMAEGEVCLNELARRITSQTRYNVNTRQLGQLFKNKMSQEKLISRYKRQNGFSSTTWRLPKYYFSDYR